jgi:hypothetical protein
MSKRKSHKTYHGDGTVSTRITESTTEQLEILREVHEKNLGVAWPCRLCLVNGIDGELIIMCPDMARLTRRAL